MDDRADEPIRSLATAENVIRDLIEEVLALEYGDRWLDRAGVTAQRLAKWNERRSEEKRRREGSVITDRLIYYSDLTDLPVILHANWNLFAPCLGDWKTIDVYLQRLVDFRLALMHGRSLLPFEEELVRGIAGEIRNRVTLWKAMGKDEVEHFARIEQVTDSFGNVATSGRVANTGLVLHPGDEVRFLLAGWDPRGGALRWSAIVVGDPDSDPIHFDGTRAFWSVKAKNIRDPAEVIFYLSGSTDYHRHTTYDDAVSFGYRVLPH